MLLGMDELQAMEANTSLHKNRTVSASATTTTSSATSSASLRSNPPVSKVESAGKGLPPPPPPPPHGSASSTLTEGQQQSLAAQIALLSSNGALHNFSQQQQAPAPSSTTMNTGLMVPMPVAEAVLRLAALAELATRQSSVTASHPQAPSLPEASRILDGPGGGGWQCPEHLRWLNTIVGLPPQLTIANHSSVATPSSNNILSSFLDPMPEHLLQGLVERSSNPSSPLFLPPMSNFHHQYHPLHPMMSHSPVHMLNNNRASSLEVMPGELLVIEALRGIGRSSSSSIQAANRRQVDTIIPSPPAPATGTFLPNHHPPMNTDQLLLVEEILREAMEVQGHMNHRGGR